MKLMKQAGQNIKKQMKNKLISIIMPVFNGEKYISDSIESVLAQTYKDFELIVVNDGSTDRTEPEIKKHNPIRYFATNHEGQANARNYGIQLSRGDYLCFLDADDLWPDWKLRLQMEYIINKPEIEMVFGHAQEFISPELSDKQKTTLAKPKDYIPGIIPGTLLIKKDSFLRVGFFDAAWKIGEFIDWYSKAIQLKMKSLVLPEILLKRRIHLSNTGLNNRQNFSDYVKIMKQSLDRKRKL